MVSRPEHEALVMAYLTGQATDDELGQYRRLYATDADFRSLVHEIEQWLAPLKGEVADVEPPEGLLDAIMAEIAETEPADPDRGILAPAKPAMLAPAPTPSPWRYAALASMLVAAIAVGSHFLPTEEAGPSAQSEALMAMLSDPSAPELIAIVYSPEDGRIVARFSNIDVPDGKTLQLWLIREGEAAPRSLGILETVPQTDQIELEIDPELRPGTDTLAVSLENQGGSSSSAPEGPVLFTGPVWQASRSGQ